MAGVSTSRNSTESRRRTAKRSTGAASRKKKTVSGRRPLVGRVSGTELSYFILIPTVVLLLLGLVMVFSASLTVGVDSGVGGYGNFIEQLIGAGVGLALMFLFSRVDYHKLGKISWLGVIFSIALLVLVLAVGKEVGGARRWLEIGSLPLVGSLSPQPTEMAKFFMVIFTAYVVAMKGDRIKKLFHLVVPVLVVLVLQAILIIMQPDLGSTLVMCFSVALILVISRTRVSHLAMAGATGSALAVYFALSAPYRRARVFSFLNPWSSPEGAGYHIIQSYIALGSGSITGVNLGMSRQKFSYLPNANTDFIFAIIGEEMGILGTSLVVCMVGLLLFGGFKAAARAPDELGKLLAAGITGLIVIQALVNMGGVTGLLPITGIPLPLVSFGWSSLCVSMACMGILLNIASQGSR